MLVILLVATFLQEDREVDMMKKKYEMGGFEGGLYLVLAALSILWSVFTYCSKYVQEEEYASARGEEFVPDARKTATLVCGKNIMPSSLFAPLSSI